MLRQEIFQTPFSMKKFFFVFFVFFNLPACGAKNTRIMQTGSSRIFKRTVPADYYQQEYLNVRFRQTTINEKEGSGTFSFTSPVTALPVS